MTRELWRDAHLLVVHKPAGIPTQRTRRSEVGVYEQLSERYPYVGLHHRLDRAASGLLLFTLDPAVNGAISDALQGRTLTRRYRAVLYGESPGGTWDFRVEGRLARSEVQILGVARGLSAAEIELHTGRKHQIRVHAAMAGTPVVGDRRYGAETAARSDRLALHATHLSLTHPVHGEPLSFDDPLPEDLQALWLQAGGPP